MKRLITLVLITFFGGILLTTTQVKATHMMGADIAWKCNGDTGFVITLTGYRDCNGIPISGAEFDLVPQSGHGGNCSGGTITATSSMTNGKDVTPVCQASCDRCTSLSCTFPFGIQQWTETVDIRFPANSCCRYEVQWQECCRNGALTTISPDNFYINAILDRCDTPCDASPYFSNPPVAIICVGQCFLFNQGVIDNNVDANGNADSLVYKLIEPLNAEGQPVTWNPPYNYKEPLDYDGAFGNPNGPWNPAKKICDGFHLDSLTGDLFFKPMKTDVTVIAIQVQVWKKNAKGVAYEAQTIQRDVQVSVIDCPADQIPELTGINGTNVTQAEFCVGVKSCFEIESYDQAANDSLKVSWNDGIPDASFTILNPTAKHPTARFCWTPKQARSYPYYFVVNCQDNFCPVNGRTSRSFDIVVNPQPQATHSTSVDNCGNVTFTAHPVVGKGIPGISAYLWSGEGNPPINSTATTFKHKYRIWGWYKYSLTITSPQGCTNSYLDSVYIPKSVEIFLPTEDTVLCLGTTMHITTTTELGTAPYSYSWNVSKSTANSINYTFASKNDSAVVVYVADQQGCTNYDSMKVHIVIPPVPIMPADTYLCAPNGSNYAPIVLNDRITAKKTNHLWQKNVFGVWTTLAVAQNIPNYTVSDSGLYRVSVSDSGVSGCAGTANIHVHYNPLVEIDTGSATLCAGDAIWLQGAKVFPVDMAGDSAHTVWSWYDPTHGKALPYTTRVINVKPGTNGIDYDVTVVETENGITCTATGEKKVVSVPKPKIIFSPIPAVCMNGGLIDLDFYGGANQGIISHSWSSTVPLVNSAISTPYFDPTKVPPSPSGKPYSLTYTVESQYNCITSSTTSITVDTLPAISVPANDTLCTSSPAYVLNGFPAGGTWLCEPTADAYLVSKSGGKYYFYPALATPGPYTLKYTYTEPKAPGCAATDSMQMYVYQTPYINITPVNNVCVGSNGFNVQATPSGGSWSSPTLSSASFSSSGYFDPTVTAPGKYWVYYTDGYPGGPSGQPDYYCNARDSTQIILNDTPTITLTPPGSPYCVKGGLQLLSASPTGGYWTGLGTGNGNYFDPNDKIVGSNTGPGTYTLTYQYTSPVTTCSNSASMQVKVDDSSWVKITSPTTLCQGTTYYLTADTINAVAIRWRRADGTPLNTACDTEAITTCFTPNLDDDLVGSVWIKAYAFPVAGNACPYAVDSIDIRIITITPAFGVTPKSGCAPLSVNFIDSSNGTVSNYVWIYGDGTKNDTTTSLIPPKHIYKNPGTYYAELIGSNTEGCPTSSPTRQITVFPSPIPWPEANPDSTPISLPVIRFQGFNSKETNSTSMYTWEFGDKSPKSTEINPIHSYSDTGSYNVNLKIKNESNGCSGDSTIRVYIEPDVLVYIPNAFVPNGVGPLKDQVFNVVASDFNAYDMKVYNRWGELLYETEDINKAWDGNFHGQPCQDDAYVYVVKITAKSGRQYTYTGTVTLLR